MALSLQLCLIGLAVILVCAVRPATAQTFQFLPEVDVYSRLAPSIRFNFQAKETREAGDPTQVEIGPGFDFFLKPLVRLKDITVLSAARNRMNESAFTIGRTGI